jgi:hypothetical protein
MAEEKNLHKQLIRKAWEDEQFAELLKTSPHEAIAKEIGIEVPANVKIQVHQEDETTLHLVVPARPRNIADTAPSALGNSAQRERSTVGYEVCRTIDCYTNAWWACIGPEYMPPIQR